MQKYQQVIDQIKADGLYKKERVIVSPQSAHIELPDGRKVLNFCANNYLGLADHPAIIQAAKKALDTHGFGLASVRFICGTQDIHKELEAKISAFFGTEDSILYSSCFAANGGLFETILDDKDAVISDQLNHASIIDGIRLCKAQRHRYPNRDLAALEDILKQTQDCERRMIVTDGVFSMDGTIAPLKAITDLAQQYDAMVVVDDSHATGFVGATGRGSAELEGVMDKIDIFTSTLGKALGGAAGGFTTGKKEVIELLRQRSRPYLFSNSLPPALVAASIEVLDLINQSHDLIQKLSANTDYFRTKVSHLGFTVAGDNHPIVPIMLGDARLASEMADRLLELGVYCIGFSFPVVPKGEARIRLQISAGHSQNDLDLALNAFATVKKEFLEN
ncbi:MAG: glycine C-acetyltransferase [Proteobacteria bacterium]|nr:MAG: glycine C-acetyltransferase [Pseudomonadota bacterium]